MRYAFGITGPSAKAFRMCSRTLPSQSSSSSSDLSNALGREIVCAFGSSSAAAEASASSIRAGNALDMFSHSDRRRCERASTIVRGVSTAGFGTIRSPHSWRIVCFCSGDSLLQLGSSASHCSPFCHAVSQSAWAALSFARRDSVASEISGGTGSGSASRRRPLRKSSRLLSKSVAPNSTNRSANRQFGSRLAILCDESFHALSLSRNVVASVASAASRSLPDRDLYEAIFGTVSGSGAGGSLPDCPAAVSRRSRSAVGFLIIAAPDSRIDLRRPGRVVSPSAGFFGWRCLLFPSRGFP